MEEDESPKEQPKNTIQCLDKKEKACLIYCSSCVFVFYFKQLFQYNTISVTSPYIHNMYSLKFTAMMVGIYDESKKAEEAAVAVESVVESLIKANY